MMLLLLFRVVWLWFVYLKPTKRQGRDADVAAITTCGFHPVVC